MRQPAGPAWLYWKLRGRSAKCVKDADLKPIWALEVALQSANETARDELAARLHYDAYFFDACVPTMGFFADEDAEIAAIREGAVNGMNITVAQQNHGFRDTIDSIRRHKGLAERRSDELAICTSVAELRQCKADGRVGMVLHFQDSKAIEDQLDNLGLFYELGLRVFQLTYNVQGLVGTGCCERHDAGLSYFGLDVVKECNRLGILIDLSHCNYATTWDAIRHSQAPVALTHVGSHALCPATGRNKSDELFKAVAEGGGVIGITVFPALVKRNPSTHEVLQADVHDVLNHIDHAVDLVGIDYVGIGSDLSNYHAKTLDVPADSSIRWYRPMRPDVFGAGPVDRYDPFPTGLDSHSTMGNITKGLLERGYPAEAVQKILGENWLRLFAQVWQNGDS